jgi:hypothetical protein
MSACAWGSSPANQTGHSCHVRVDADLCDEHAALLRQLEEQANKPPEKITLKSLSDRIDILVGIVSDLMERVDSSERVTTTTGIIR